MQTSKTYLEYLYLITSFSQPYPDPFRETVLTAIFYSTFQSFLQIENSSFFVYLAVTIIVIGAILMFFEGISLEVIDEDEEIIKEKLKNKV